jgi:hypothetical protein
VYINNNKTILGALSSTLIAVLFLSSCFTSIFLLGHLGMWDTGFGVFTRCSSVAALLMLIISTYSFTGMKLLVANTLRLSLYYYSVSSIFWLSVCSFVLVFRRNSGGDSANWPAVKTP